MRMRLFIIHDGMEEDGRAFNDIEPVRSADVVLGERSPIEIRPIVVPSLFVRREASVR